MQQASSGFALLSVKWGGIGCQSEKLKTSKEGADLQIKVLHIVFSFDKLARE